MNLLREIIAQFLPTKDVKILELRRIIKNLKEENSNLKEKIEKFDSDKRIPIQLYDEEIEDIIIKNLKEAHEEICIAMAWFTSKSILEVLSDLKSKGVNIKIIIDNNKVNRKVGLWDFCNVLKIADVNVPGRKNNLMHNKYCIIDKKRVIDGSYNWSCNAKYNIEHIIVIDDIDLAKKYRESFDKIFNNQRYYSNYTVSENVV